MSWASLFFNQSRISSSMDWCEPNGAISPYIAEFWNTLSSIPVATFAISGLIHCIQKELGFFNILTHFLVFIVGIGSVFFHGTLTGYGQCMDEIPMLWASSMMLFAILRIRFSEDLAINASSTAKSKFSKTFVAGVVLLTSNVAVTIKYFSQDFLLFIFVYSATVASMIIFSWLHISDLEKKKVSCNNNNKDSSSSDSSYHIQTHKKLLMYAAYVYVGGSLFLWIPEQIFCGNRLHSTHETIFESLNLHAFFHLTSAVGSYTMCVFVSFADFSRVETPPFPKIQYERSLLSFGFLLPKVFLRRHFADDCSTAREDSVSTTSVQEKNNNNDRNKTSATNKRKRSSSSRKKK